MKILEESRSSGDDLQDLSQHALKVGFQDEELRNRLSRSEAELAAAGEQLDAARRDVHFLRLRVGMLQAYGDDLLVEVSNRSADAVTLAAAYDEMLADRDRVIRETVTSFEDRVAFMIERIESLALSGAEQRAAESQRHERELAARDRQVASVLTSKSWKLTRPLRLLISLFRGGRTKPRVGRARSPFAISRRLWHFVRARSSRKA